MRSIDSYTILRIILERFKSMDKTIKKYEAWVKNFNSLTIKLLSPKPTDIELQPAHLHSLILLVGGIDDKFLLSIEPKDDSDKRWVWLQFLPAYRNLPRLLCKLYNRSRNCTISHKSADFKLLIEYCLRFLAIFSEILNISLAS